MHECGLSVSTHYSPINVSELQSSQTHRSFSAIVVQDLIRHRLMYLNACEKDGMIGNESVMQSHMLLVPETL